MILPVLCRKCGQRCANLQGLANHVTKTHSMKWSEYVESYGADKVPDKLILQSTLDGEV